MEAKVVTVTPKLAEKWLGTNTHNRNIRQRAVEQFAGAITRGEWIMNGDAVRFDKHGKLIDGQHRLLAVVKSGKNIQSLVVSGLDPTAQETIDAGAKRTFSDILRLRGETNTALLGAIVRLHWRYKNQRDEMIARNYMPTPQQLLAHLENNDHMREATRRSATLLSYIKGAGSVYGTGIALGLELDEDDTDFFLEKLCTGTELSADSPIYHLRTFLQKQNERREKVRQEYQLAMWIKAWNAYREGRSMELLIFRSGGKRGAERMPEVR